MQIDTPLTNDANGNLYFGFLALGATPLNLQSGLARIASDGTGTWVSAATASGDSVHDGGIDQRCTRAVFRWQPPVCRGRQRFCRILAGFEQHDARTRKPSPLDRSILGIGRVDLCDCSSATPTVGPDGDVYFGVLENPFPSHNDRGWLLHFNSDLTQTKIPGSFGWDDTASIVPASLVTSYHGSSSYLLMTKYNNYGGVGTGDGKNRIAILDPNANENDPILPTTHVMKEVITILGVTPDPDYPGGVKEWCINTAAIDPFTKSVLANSEDGNLYRWDLTANTLSEVITLSTGVGEAYTPTAIGSDGTAYAINDAILDAIGH